ncbi:MAG: hypothetical protein LBD78_04090 [Spirochaetaceae bacterium]|jgi:DNA-directed RNA polymerase specialized sigma24 family protein|nr:hypothetical protein [Spirochaetaceae bacterium]
MKGYGRTGFYSYLETGEFTKDFIADVDRLIKKIYSRWRLYEDYDEFHAFCWAKIVRAMRTYEEQNGREIGPVSTYLYQVIMNEARRLYSKFKKVTYDDVDEVLEMGVISQGSVESQDDFDVRDRLRGFAVRAYGMGVFVDQNSLYKNYCQGVSSAAVKAFTWCGILGI